MEAEAWLAQRWAVGSRSLTRHGGRTFWVSDFTSAGGTGGATEALARALGVADHEAASRDLLTAYKRLASPFEQLKVWRAGGGGDQEAATLDVARRYDLLRSVLRGPNPEGRALAAVALKEAGALTPADSAHRRGPCPIPRRDRYRCRRRHGRPRAVFKVLLAPPLASAKRPRMVIPLSGVPRRPGRRRSRCPLGREHRA